MYRLEILGKRERNVIKEYIDLTLCINSIKILTQDKTHVQHSRREPIYFFQFQTLQTNTYNSRESDDNVNKNYNFINNKFP